jgi:uncharacterized protein
MARLRIIGWVVATFLVATLAWAAPNFPAFTSSVVDAARVIPADNITILENQLRDYQASSGHQIAVATVSSLEGYDIRDYGYQLGRAWGVGDKTKNDGVLVLVAPNERKVSIEVGYGLEGDLTDAMSRIIIENAMVPRFKAGDYAGGISAGLEDIKKVVGGEGDLVTQRINNQSSGSQDILPFIIFFIIVVFILMNASRGGRMIIVPGAYGGGGFSRGGFGGGGGGGGFSGGGGGSFGGGGASGGW